MKSPRTLYIGWLLIAFGVFVLVGLLHGCAAMGQAQPSASHPFTAVDKTLRTIAAASGGIYGLSILTIGIGVVLMIYLKTSLGPAIVAGGAVTLVLSLLVSSIVWFIPWIAGLLVLGGGLAFAIDVKKRGFKNALLDVRQVLHYPVIKM